MKKLLCLIITGLLFTVSYAEEITGNATPSEYDVTIKSVGFVDSNGTFHVLSNSPQVFDIASGAVGTNVGFFGGDKTLPPGTYTEVRMVVSSTFGLKGSAAKGVIPGGGSLSNTGCETGSGAGSIEDVSNYPETGNTTTLADLSPDYTGTSSPSLQQVRLPVGNWITLPSEMTRDTSAGTITVDMGMPDFTLTTTSAPPEMQFTFDITNQMQFVARSATTCMILPTPPRVCIKIISSGVEECTTYST